MHRCSPIHFMLPGWTINFKTSIKCFVLRLIDMTSFRASHGVIKMTLSHEDSNSDNVVLFALIRKKINQI